jgi:oligosaccharide repeat unit polymerase
VRCLFQKSEQAIVKTERDVRKELFLVNTNSPAISPLVLMGAPWAFALLLYFFKATDNLVDLSSNLILIFVLMGILFLFATLAPLLVRTRCARNQYINLPRLNNAVKFLFVVWIIGSVVDIIYSGGLPLYWAYIGSDKNYTEFGIPSFHGLINSFYFALIACVCVRAFTCAGSKWHIFLFCLCGWPVLMLGRGILLTVLLQICLIYVFYVGVTLRMLRRLAIAAILVTIFFGVLGDLRGSENPFHGLVNPEYESFFQLLPSGFLWVYIYVTSPLANFAYNYETLTPVLEFYYSTVNLFPTFLRPAGLDRADNFLFVNEALNVSTIFASSHSDFGSSGDIALLLLLSGWAAFWFLLMIRRNIYILPYSVVGVVLFFSVFYNLFLLYPYLFSTVLLGFIARYIER